MYVGSAPSHPGDYAQAAQDLRQLASKISLTKRRERRWYDSGLSLQVEQTDIAIERHAKPRWRSICLEGELGKIENVLSREVSIATQRNGGGREKLSLEDYLIAGSAMGGACGYPQLVVNLV